MNDLIIFWQYIKFIWANIIEAMKQLFDFLLDETDDSEEY